MSRKWSRLVDKNKKIVNEHRKKRGEELLSQSKTDTKIVGRSWVLPSFLLGMLIWYLILFIGERGFMFWFTVIGYSFLILFLFFIKRPYLVIGKDYIESRRFTGVFRIKVDEIKKIVFTGDSVHISFNVKRPAWSYTKMFQLIDIQLMVEKLRDFADKNQIPWEMKGN